MRDHFGFSTNKTHKDINLLFTTMVNVLADKKISYSDLKNVLVPKPDRQEAGFIFDSNQIESSIYGQEVFSKFLPLLEESSKHSVLVGDLLCNDQATIIDILNEFLVAGNNFKFIHGTLLFCVYLNNLTDHALEQLHAKLLNVPFYIGYLPTKYDSIAKTFLSTTVGNKCIKYNNTLILMHEDDRSNKEDVNITIFDFEGLGFKIKSIQELYFNLFLSYKIERAIFPGFELDTEISINSITSDVLQIEKFQIEIEENKFNYLQAEKRGKLHKAGVLHLNKEQLTELIRKKITASYIYNMQFNEQHNVMKFSLIIEAINRDENRVVKLLAVFEYKPKEKILRLITLY